MVHQYFPVCPPTLYDGIIPYSNLPTSSRGLQAYMRWCHLQVQDFLRLENKILSSSPKMTDPNMPVPKFS